MPPIPQRFTALDVFRGITICLMIIVNTPGNAETTFAPLLHARWHGFTPTDLVFPSFLFATGNALSFAISKWQTMPQKKVLLLIFKRTIILFLLGFLMYWFPFVRYDENQHLYLSPINETRIFGVLQRIALAYCIASLLIYFYKARTVVFISVIILFLYWPVLYYFGDIEDPFALADNAVLRLDRFLIGDRHLYIGEGVPFDPEGLLSTFPSVVNVVAGYIAGRHIRAHGNSYEGLSKLLLAGFVMLVIGHFWQYDFPINKKLWTSTFVLHTIALDCLLLGCILYYLDFAKHGRGTYFFEVFGRNPLFIYLLSEVVLILLYIFTIDGEPLISYMFTHLFIHATPYFGSLLFAMSYMLFCWLIGFALDRKKIYIKV